MAEVCSVVVLGRRELSLVGDCGDVFGEDGFETTSLAGFISLPLVASNWGSLVRTFEKFITV